MTFTEERDRFMRASQEAGIAYDAARTLLRCATTLQRLAVAQCNGDYPCDNGERKTIPCPVCESGYVPSQITGGARAEAAWSRANNSALSTVPGHDPNRDVVYGAVLKACPDCRTQSIVFEALKGSQLMPHFQGDPRGPILQLYPLGTAHEDIDSGRARAIYVPARER